jgi:hypothetical protein
MDAEYWIMSYDHDALAAQAQITEVELVYGNPRKFDNRRDYRVTVNLPDNPQAYLDNC